jgi:hypothetical protein
MSHSSAVSLLKEGSEIRVPVPSRDGFFLEVAKNRKGFVFGFRPSPLFTARWPMLTCSLKHIS